MILSVFFSFQKQDFRPMTHAQIPSKKEETRRSSITVIADENCTSSVLCEKSLSIAILNVWNENCPFLGLAGLEVIGETGKAVDVAAIESSLKDDQNVQRRVKIVNEFFSNRLKLCVALCMNLQIELKFSPWNIFKI